RVDARQKLIALRICEFVQDLAFALQPVEEIDLVLALEPLAVQDVPIVLRTDETPELRGELGRERLAMALPVAVIDDDLPIRIGRDVDLRPMPMDLGLTPPAGVEHSPDRGGVGADLRFRMDRPDEGRGIFHHRRTEY